MSVGSDILNIGSSKWEENNALERQMDFATPSNFMLPAVANVSLLITSVFLIVKMFMYCAYRSYIL